MLKKIIILVIIVIAVVLGIVFWPKFLNPQNKQTACTMEAKLCPDGSSVGRSGPNCQFAPCPASKSDLLNLTYTIDGQAIPLVKGYNEQAIPGSAEKVITRYFGNEVISDFNNDQKEDAAFLITQSRGGTGVFYYAVVALGDGNGGYIPFATDLIGDRIAPQTTEFRDGMIIFNYADRKANEPFTVAPSIGLSKYYRVIYNQLRPVIPPMQQSEKVDALKKIIVEKYPKYADTLQIGIKQEYGNYVVGSITFVQGQPGGQFLAVRIQDVWQLVYEGNGNVDCFTIQDKYKFPHEMLAGMCD